MACEGARKVVLLGDSRVGKTSIIERQLSGCEPPTQSPTIGCLCSEVPCGDGAAPLDVWDTAGQEMYRSLVPLYLRDARAALLVYDITSRDSFHSLGHWLDAFAAAVPSGAAVYVVANKIDLADAQAVGDADAARFAGAHGARLFKVSAATGFGLAGLFDAVAQGMAPGAARADEAERPPPPAAAAPCGC
jgi:small GTP-binding protein